jgi:hypothetical protein
MPTENFVPGETHAHQISNGETKSLKNSEQRMTSELWSERTKIIIEYLTSMGIKIAAPSPLDIKRDFGDIDLVIVSPHPVSEENMTLIDTLNHESSPIHIAQYHHQKNNHADTVATFIDGSTTTPVSIDFIRAVDDEDFETKKIYYSKYPLSAFLGTMARSLGFTYGEDGFSFHHTDSHPNHKKHNVLITKDLKVGMAIMGLDASILDSLQSEEDLINFVKSSPYYSPDQFSPGNRSPKRKGLLNKETDKAMKEKLLYQQLAQTLPTHKSREQSRQECLANFSLTYPTECTRIQAELARIEAKP